MSFSDADKDEPNLIMLPTGGLLEHFLMANSFLVCALLICIHQSNASLCHTFVLQKTGAFCLDYLRKNIISRNTLPIILFQITPFITIKASDILIFLNISRNCSSYQSITLSMRSNTSHISDPFIYLYQSCLQRSNHPFAF